MSSLEDIKKVEARIKAGAASAAWLKKARDLHPDAQALVDSAFPGWRGPNPAHANLLNDLSTHFDFTREPPTLSSPSPYERALAQLTREVATAAATPASFDPDTLLALHSLDRRISLLTDREAQFVRMAPLLRGWVEANRRSPLLRAATPAERSLASFRMRARGLSKRGSLTALEGHLWAVTTS